VIVGTAFNETTAQYEAVMWVPVAAVPEPGGIGVMVVGAVMIARRRRISCRRERS